MTTSYIPTKDADLVPWENNFQTLVAASPATYGLTAGDATALTAEYAAYLAAYNSAINPTTRTSVTVNTKDVTRNASIAVYRAYSGIVRSNLGVTDANKIALGVPPRDPSNTPVPPPATNPILSPISATTLAMTVQVRDVMTPDSRAKPAGVVQLELHVLVSATAPTSPAATPYFGIFTKTPMQLEFGVGDVGKTAWMYGRWMNRKGETGPWSPLASMTVVG